MLGRPDGHDPGTVPIRKLKFSVFQCESNWVCYEMIFLSS